MRTLRTGTAAAFLVAITAALMAPAGTAAHGFEAGSRISALRTATGFTGTVTSKHRLCRRRVSLSLVQENLASTTAQYVGSTRTGRRGRWSLQVTLAPGRYYFRMAPFVYEDFRRHSHTCIGDQSASFDIG